MWVFKIFLRKGYFVYIYICNYILISKTDLTGFLEPRFIFFIQQTIATIIVSLTCLYTACLYTAMSHRTGQSLYNYLVFFSWEVLLDRSKEVRRYFTSTQASPSCCHDISSEICSIHYYFKYTLSRGLDCT